jgi:hypothetical protein
MKLIVQLAMFVFLGLGLSAIAVFVGTITDKTLRSAEEVRNRLAVPLLAVVPESRGFAAQRQKTDLKAEAAATKGRRRRAKGDQPKNFEDVRQLEAQHANR